MSYSTQLSSDGRKRKSPDEMVPNACQSCKKHTQSTHSALLTVDLTIVQVLIEEIKSSLLL